METKFKRVVIAGAGGVGYWLTWILCRELNNVIPVEVYDPDTFDGGNGFRRLPLCTDKTKKKVQLLKVHVPFIMGDTAPTIHGKLLTELDFESGDWNDTLVVDCTDMDQPQRVAFWKALKASGASGIRISYDGLGVATISPGPPMMAGGAVSGGYQIMPNIAHSFGAAGLGGQAVLYMLETGKCLEFQVHVPTPRTSNVDIRQEEEE